MVVPLSVFATILVGDKQIETIAQPGGHHIAVHYFVVVWVVKYIFHLVEQLTTRWRSTPLDPRLSGGRWRAEIFQHQGEVLEPLWWRTPSSSPAG